MGVNETETETGGGGPPRSSTAEERRLVSVEAISWALNLAPVPADRGGQPRFWPGEDVRAGATPEPAKLARWAGCPQMNQDLWPCSGLRRLG